MKTTSGPRYGGADIGGKLQTSGFQIPAQVLLTARFVDGGNTLVQGLDLFGVHIDAHNAVAEIGETQGRD